MDHPHNGTDPDEVEGIEQPHKRHALPTRPASEREQTHLQQTERDEETANAPSASENEPSELSRGAWLGVGLAGFFSTLGSEMLAPIRILFLVAVLRMPLYLVGLIEGAAIGASILMRLWPAHLADAGGRKSLAAIGYGVSTIARALLALVSAWPLILLVVSLDNAGKKLGDRQRHAILADSGPGEHLSRAVSFHQRMSALGAILGPLLAYLLLQTTPGDLRVLLLATAVPGIFAVLLFLILYPGHAKRSPSSLRSLLSIQNPKSKFQNPKSLGLRFWMHTGTSAVFALGNISVAFMVLRGAGLEKVALLVPLMYLAYKLTQLLLGRPLGALSERWGRLPMLISAQVLIILIYAGWAGASLAWHSWALFVAYGVYAAATAEVATGFAADIVPHEAREQALGWFSVSTGVAVIVGNMIAGWLWSLAGPGAAFTYGAWAVAVALVLSIAWLPWLLGKGYLPQSSQVT